MNKFILLTILLISFSIFGSVPTVEGLFRHPSNEENNFDTSIVTFKIKTVMPEVKAEKEKDGEVKTPENLEYSVKYIFDTGLTSQVRMIQVVYDSEEMTDENIVSISYVNNISDDTFTRQRKILLSTFSSLLLNRSVEMMKYLKEISKDIKNNEEMINIEKKKLLENYKRYLADKKNDIEVGESPLKPENDESKLAVKETLKSSFYTQDSAVKLNRKDKEFFWFLSLDNIDGTFENETLRMRELKMNNISSTDRLLLSDYVLINGKNEFPKRFSLFSDDVQYIIEAKRVYHFDTRDKSIRKRYNEYLKKGKKGVFTLKEISHPLL